MAGFGHAPVRRGRRGRHRADGVGAAASGMEPRLVACRMVAFLVLLYSVYAALAADRRHRPRDRRCSPAGARSRSRSCRRSPASCCSWSPARSRSCPKTSSGAWRAGRPDRAAPPTSCALGDGTGARRQRRAHRHGPDSRTPSRAARGVVWWTFDILVLWAMFHAFGTPPPLSVIWMCYFVGLLANLLPLPGGLGGVEGGMIGAFAAFGVSFDLSVLAVLSYRAISFWLPTIPGGIAYFQLRRTVASGRASSPRWGPARRGRCPAKLVHCRAREPDGQGAALEPTRGTGAAGGCGRVQAGRYQRPAVIVSVVARPAASRTRNGKRSSACRWWRTEALSAAPARSSGQRARRRAPASGRRNDTVSSAPRTLVRRSTRLPVASRRGRRDAEVAVSAKSQAPAGASARSCSARGR